MRHPLQTVLPLSDNATISRLMDAYYPTLQRIASSRLRSVNTSVMDADDAVSSAFTAFWQGVTEGKFSITSDQDVYWVLNLLTSRRCNNIIQYIRYQRRSSFSTQSLDDATADGIMGADADPASTLCAADMLSVLLSRLDETDRRILTHRLDGFSLDNISEALDMDKGAIKQRLQRLKNTIRTMRDYQ
jgi:RNA polymerase sigma factor (sigma-70 family)